MSTKLGKITCTTCGKVWQNSGEFEDDIKLCGGEHCPIKATRDAEAKQEANNVIQIIQNRSRSKNKKPQEVTGEVDESYDNITVNIHTGTVDDEYGRLRTEACYYEDVPKVIAVEIRKIKRAA